MFLKFRFMIFFLVMLAVITLVNLYIYSHILGFFPNGNPIRWLCTILFWLVAFSYVAGRFAERAGAGWLAVPLVKTGSWWLGAMVYLTLLFLLADVFRGVFWISGLNRIMGFTWISDKGKWISLAICGMSAVILISGYLNALYPVVRKQRVVLDKPVPSGILKTILISDIHLGMMISKGRLSRIVELVNRQNADVVLIAGDVFDEDLGPVIRNNLGDLLKNLMAKEGVFAILGNHEFYGNTAEAQRYLENHHITVLRDSVVQLPGGITIIGREDITNRQMFGKERKSLETLLSGFDTSKPVIVMDHQPVRLREVSDFPVDLQVSGHTHHGQMWPFNYITGAMYDISKGYGKINQTHFYVSPGVGTWGAPVRTSCRPEITVLEITGK